MSPATAWTELTVPDGGWQIGFPAFGWDPDDLFIDVLFEGTPFLMPSIPAWVEHSVPATVGTELSVAATTWTELT